MTNRQSVGAIAVIDPAVRVPELDCFNQLAMRAGQPLTYHLPAMYGMASLATLESDHQPIKGFIILGSGASVYDKLPWQKPLEDWLMPHLTRGIPTIGLCYGHQMLAHMFGGQIGFVNDAQNKLTGFRPVQLENCVFGDTVANLVVSHKEEVKQLPSDFRVIGKSNAIRIDAMAHKSLPVFGFQSHPEATASFMSNQAIPFEGNHLLFADGARIMDIFLQICRV